MMAAEVIKAGRALAHGPQDDREAAANQLRTYVISNDTSAIISEFKSLLGESDAAVRQASCSYSIFLITFTESLPLTSFLVILFCSNI